MSFKPDRKETFKWYGTGGDQSQGGHHIFICLCINLSNASPQYLLVPICTFKGNSDATCKLDKAACADLEHQSYAGYFKARITEQSVLDAADFGAKIRPALPITEDAFQRVCDGLLASTETALKCKTFYRQHYLP